MYPRYFSQEPYIEVFEPNAVEPVPAEKYLLEGISTVQHDPLAKLLTYEFYQKQVTHKGVIQPVVVMKAVWPFHALGRAMDISARAISTATKRNFRIIRS